MRELQAVRGKIVALREKLETKPGDALPGKQASPTSAPRGIRTDGPALSVYSPTSGSLPKHLTQRAHVLLDQARTLLQQLRTLAEGSLTLEQPGLEPHYRDRCRETTAMLEVIVRLVQSFPEPASAQLRLCDGLEAMLAVAAERIQLLTECSAESRHERMLVRRLLDLFKALEARRPVALDAFRSIAQGLVTEVDESRPLRFPGVVPESTELEVAAHCLTTARVAARIVRGDAELRQAPLEPILAALVHDVGMLAVPSSAWAHAGALNENQRQLIKEHTRAGAALLMHHFGREGWLVEATAAHHERLDGSGYPGAYKLNKITHLTRFLAVCDVYAARASARHHRPAFDPRSALTDTLLQAEHGELDKRCGEILLQLSFYPVGSVVEMADGSIGVVVAVHTNHTDLTTLARPVVALLVDSESRPFAQTRPIDLMQDSHRSIVRTLDMAQRREVLGARFPEWL